MRLLWPQLMAIDLFPQAPALQVPAHFLLGRRDQEAPSAAAERYFQALRAPHEALLWFEKSAHFVNTEEAEAFSQFFVERLLGETGGADGATAAPSL